MPLRTPLYDWHVKHGGRMVDFGGWDMPIQYSTITDEHIAVRSNAGIFDVSHMGRLSFDGPSALPMIESVFTNNATSMKEFQVRYGLICNDKGGIQDDILVYRWPTYWSMVVNASNRGKIVSCLDQRRVGFDVTISDRTEKTCMIAIQGPKALEICQELTPAEMPSLPYYHALAAKYRGSDYIVSRTGYTGEDGLEFVTDIAFGLELWEELARRGAKPCGLGARDTLRLEAAMPLYGHELNEEIDPLQAGLGWAVKLDKGEFLGREALLKRETTRRAEFAWAWNSKPNGSLVKGRWSSPRTNRSAW